MQAIEFETYISKRAIQIPSRFHIKEHAKVKVTLSYDKPEDGNYDKKRFLSALNKAKQKGVFNDINNPVVWQKQQRDEWE